MQYLKKYWKLLKKLILKILDFSTNIFSESIVGQRIINTMINSSMNKSVVVNFKEVSLRVTTPNPLCAWRAQTFSTKEPETLEWIDRFHVNAIFWDIGANVGLYSLYAAKAKSARVWAFEPSVFNLELLARNIAINNLVSNIHIVPVALTDVSGESLLKFTTTEWGGALSTFGKNFGWDGNPIKKIFEYQTIGFSIEDAQKFLSLPSPEYMKIDVDGLEHFILSGGRQTLKNVKSVLVEVNDNFKEQAATCETILTESGLVLSAKKQGEMIASSSMGFQQSFNQIWIRE